MFPIDSCFATHSLHGSKDDSVCQSVHHFGPDWNISTCHNSCWKHEAERENPNADRQIQRIGELMGATHAQTNKTMQGQEEVNSGDRGRLATTVNTSKCRKGLTISLVRWSKMDRWNRADRERWSSRKKGSCNNLAEGKVKQTGTL